MKRNRNPGTLSYDHIIWRKTWLGEMWREAEEEKETDRVLVSRRKSVEYQTLTNQGVHASGLRDHIVGCVYTLYAQGQRLIPNITWSPEATLKPTACRAKTKKICI